MAKGIPHPLQWNMRERVEVDVAVGHAGVQPKVTALIQMLRWVSCTPFGRAVVPEV